MTLAEQLRAVPRILASNVLRQREAQRLTIEAAAWKAQMAPRHWSKIEAGRANPTVYTLVRISFALGVALSDLFASQR